LTARLNANVRHIAMMTETNMELVSESIKPVVSTIDPSAMAIGGPGLPREFVWRGEPLGVAAVLRTWRETGPCTHGSSESYVRKHWFEVRTTGNRRARIYFERQPRGRDRTKRWWLFSIEQADQEGKPLSSGSHLEIQSEKSLERSKDG